MRRVGGLIPDIQCPNWDNRLCRNSAATCLDPARISPDARNNPQKARMPDSAAAELVALVIDQLGDLGQAIAVARADDHEADAAFGPEQRAVPSLRGVAHLSRL